MVVTITLSVDEATLERARAAAGVRHQTLEQIVATVVEELGAPQGISRAASQQGEAVETGGTGLIGLFAAEPELADAIEHEAGRLRGERWSRIPDDAERREQ